MKLPIPRSALADRLSPAGLTALVGLAALSWLVACGPAPAPRYDDLVAGERLASSFSGPGGEQLACAGETHFARAVRPGEELTATLTLGGAPRLVLTACRRQPELDASADGQGEGDDSGGGLRVTITAGERTLTRDWPFRGERGWWRRELDLEALSGRRVEVKLEGAFAGPRRTFLKELFVEHSMPAPARRRSPRDGGPRQILLISVDTLRHDALGALGGAVPTPALDRLAADGEIFAPHYAGSSWTKPSHATLLTGYGVGVHGSSKFTEPIPAAVPTLAERFQAAGFATGGLVHDCVWLDPKFGFRRGFDDYRSEIWDAEPLTRAAANWMLARRDRPFFFFLHLFDAHSDFHQLPYEAPGVTQDTVAARFGVERYGCRGGECASGLLQAINRRRLEPLPGEAEILRFLYDGGVRRVDRAVGGLLDDLAAADLYDDLLIVFTSDHGEAFLEHGKLIHSWWWEEVIRVPLIVKWPQGGEPSGDGRQGEPASRGPSSAVDVAPTLLSAAGIPHDGLPGVDLRTRRADRPVFASSMWTTVVSGSMKAIRPLKKSGRLHLYDLAADPGERHNLAGERPEELARLLALLDARAAADRDLRATLVAANRRGRAGGAGALTAEERARLRALGYVDGGADGE